MTLEAIFGISDRFAVAQEGDMVEGWFSHKRLIYHSTKIRRSNEVIIN
jgi:hypothetical protein